MADPSSLDALPARNDAGRWPAVLEAPQGTRHKLKYRPEWRAFVLSGVLPLGLSFPYDFAALEEIEHFFVVYNARKGGRFTPLARRGAAAATRLGERGRRCYASGR